MSAIYLKGKLTFCFCLRGAILAHKEPGGSSPVCPYKIRHCPAHRPAADLEGAEPAYAQPKLEQTSVNTPCLKKTATLFLSALCQISTNFDSFYRKMAKRLKLCEMYSFSTSPNFTSSHYRVKRRCSKLLHSAESCYLQ